jgi:hypothetical protein
MAHLVPHNAGGGGGGGMSNAVPIIVSKFINHSMDDDDPVAESDDGSGKRNRKKTKIVGDVRLVNKEFSKLRVAEFCNAYLGMIGLGICIIERENRYVYGHYDNDSIRIILLSLNFLTTIGLLISLYFSY